MGRDGGSRAREEEGRRGAVRGGLGREAREDRALEGEKKADVGRGGTSLHDS